MRGVREAALQQGRRVIGTFHSHPIGHAEPGPRDRRSCPNGAYMLIYDVCGRMPRLWQIQRRRGRRQAREVAIRLEARP
jgi:proteasome lid subunit RPN8/RPN11